VLRLKESVPHHGSAAAVVFDVAAMKKPVAVAMQAAHVENLVTIRLPLPPWKYSPLVGEL
jgi:hypothetical protein